LIEAAGRPGEHLSAFWSDFIAQGRRVGEWLSSDRRQGVHRNSQRRARRSQLIGLRFRDAIGSYPHMKIVATQTADFSRGSARNGKHHPGQGSRHHRVYAHNDEMALGAIQALKSAGMKPAVLMDVSIDGEKAALEAIIRGELGVRCRVKPAFWPTCFRHDGEVFCRREDSSQDHSQGQTLRRDQR